MSVFSPGQRLRDRYVLVARIGAGGMSEVWRATDQVLGRDVAVKALATPLVAGARARELIWREARAVARLNHPHIAQVHDYGEAPLPEGTAGYLVMELLTGRTLADRLGEGPLRWPEAARLAGQVAAALAAAHERGLVHRDIKPGNVMLTSAGAKVLDFGIAAVAGHTDTDPGLVGTPAYAAPERFDTTAAAQPASDLYSFGVLLYECLVGRPPLSVHSWPEAQAAQRGGLAPPHPPVPGLPAPLVRLCQSCLSPDPVARPSAAEAARELAGLAGEPAPDAAGAAVQAGAIAVGRSAASDGAAAAGGRSVPTPRYAVGAAALPAPATQVSDGGFTGPLAPRWRRWAGPAAAAVVTVLALVLLVAMLPGGGQSPGAASDPPAGSGAPVTPAPSVTGPATDAPDGGPGADPLQEVDVVLADGLVRGALTPDAHEDLSEELADLRELLSAGQARSQDAHAQLADVREEIDELVEDRELDPATADQLRALLATLPVTPAGG